MAPPSVSDRRELSGRHGGGDRQPGRGADRGADQRRRQPAVLLLDELVVAATSSISVVFKPGSDPDINQVNVQNRVSQALSLLPQTVTQQGVTVEKHVVGHHDGAVDLFARRPLHVDVHRQLHEPVRPRRAEARARRQSRLRVRPARHRDARVAAARPHGAARHHRAARCATRCRARTRRSASARSAASRRCRARSRRS